MKQLTIGDVTITSIIERDGPWRKPEDMFPAYDADIGKRHLAALDKEVYDPVSGKMVITYQTYVVRTPKHTMLVDTCTGEDKGYPAPAGRRRLSARRQYLADADAGPLTLPLLRQ